MPCCLLYWHDPKPFKLGELRIFWQNSITHLKGFESSWELRWHEKWQQGIKVNKFYCQNITISAIMYINVFPHTNLWKNSNHCNTIPPGESHVLRIQTWLLHNSMCWLCLLWPNVHTKVKKEIKNILITPCRVSLGYL